MIISNLVCHFFGGAFLVNAIPHIVSGTMGRPFQSPFATPRGRGLSSAAVNVIWGTLNVLIAYLLLVQVGEFNLHAIPDFISALTGGFLLALFLALHFGRFNSGN